MMNLCFWQIYFLIFPTEVSLFCKFEVKNMRVSRSDAFIYEKRVKFQVEFPGNEIQFPGSQNPLDRIFYTYGWCYVYLIIQ